MDLDRIFGFATSARAKAVPGSGNSEVWVRRISEGGF
jgi:hypothetical protein